MTTSTSRCAKGRSSDLSAVRAPENRSSLTRSSDSSGRTVVEFEFFGRDVDDPEANAQIDRRAGVMFQGGALFSALTVGQNVEAPIYEHAKLPNSLIRELARLKIRLVGLDDRVVDQMPASLSGGMRKRAGIARALALDPEVLFLDEPTAGLDPMSAAEFDQLNSEFVRLSGLTVLIVTHDLDTLHAITDRVAVLAEKRVIAIAPIAQLQRSEQPWIKGYFNGPRGRAAEASYFDKRRTH